MIHAAFATLRGRYHDTPYAIHLIWGMSSGNIIRLWCTNCRNTEFDRAILLMSFAEVVAHRTLFRISQSVQLHHVLPKPLHALLYHIGDGAHHPVGFLVIAQLAKLCIFIVVIFPILLNVRPCKLAQTVSDSNNHLMKLGFRGYGCQSLIVTYPQIVLLWLNRCFCSFNTLSCHSGFSFNIILESLHSVFMTGSNGSGASLRVPVRVQTKLLPNLRSRSSIGLNCQLGYGVMVNSQPVRIGPVVSELPSWSICRFISGSCFYRLLIVSYQHRVFNNQ